MDDQSLYMFWWIIAGVFLFLEFLTPATIFIFPAIVAVFIGVMAIFIENVWIQGAVFFVVSGVVLSLVRPLFVNGKNDIGYKQGVDSLQGKRVKVIEKISQFNKGRVQNGADIFPAIADEDIAKGEIVEIVSIEGITVTVKKI